jgi:hypothetical protein
VEPAIGPEACTAGGSQLVAPAAGIALAPQQAVAFTPVKRFMEERFASRIVA